jgi:peptide/nickel transport system permease protein
VASFLFQRITYALLVMLAVASLAFAAVHLSGDPLAGFTAPGASPADQTAIREHLGLDRPLSIQYLRFVERAAHGDFGDSWRAREPAMRAVLDRLPATLRLAGAALALALVIGVPLGALAGAKPGGPLDFIASTVALLGQALPGFWLGILLILVFSVRLHWLPSSGGDGWRALVLPAATLAAYPAAFLARLVRSSVIETLNQDFMRTARGKGLREATVIHVHALRNALLPALAFTGIQAGFLLGGAVVIESVFAYPGIGQLALQAVADRDLPVIQAFVVLVGGMIVLVNLLVEIASRKLDPRLSISSEGSRAWV